jgi:hypothetical protein
MQRSQPKYGHHMTNASRSETGVVTEEVSLLEIQIGRLQQLIAELLMKNQQLREALSDRNT